MDATPATSALPATATLSAPPQQAATISRESPRLAAADHPFAVQFQSTQTDANRTKTPSADNETFDFSVDSGASLPEPPPGYDLLRPLGSGGMGSVYLAFEHATERRVAIKLLNAPNNGSALDRFLVEIRVLADLNHPHIINVFDAKTHGREPYFTMGYAEGGTLANLANPDRLVSPREAARLMQITGEAIAVAHAAGILHRDLKPSNVLLKRAGGEKSTLVAEPPGSTVTDSTLFVPVVSDFGLAKRTDRDDGLTRTGAMGTPQYMSPEAAAGKYREFSPATDVYGLGATFYHLLTGRPPFEGDTQHIILNKVLSGTVVRPRLLRPEVPEYLEAIAMKALERSPAARYSSATAFAEDLKRYLAGDTPLAPVLSRRRRGMLWVKHNRKTLGVAVSVMLAAAGLVIAGWKYGPNVRSSEPTESVKEPPPAPPVAPQTPDQWLTEARARLQRGESVEFIGPAGLPKYHKSWLGPLTLGESPLGDGSCSFDSFDYTLLELAPDLGIDRYRIVLELRRRASKIPPDPGGVETDALGVYFGFAPGQGNDGRFAHAMFGLTYMDYEPVRGITVKDRRQSVSLQKIGLLQNTKLEFERYRNQLPPSLLFTPASRPPADWRPIVIDVSPQEVHIRWRADARRNSFTALLGGAAAMNGNPSGWTDDNGMMITLARLSGAKIRADYEKLKSELDPFVPGVSFALPRWNPRMPFGVYAYRSSVSVRNVTMIPNP